MASTITVWLRGNDSWPWTTCQEERRPSLLSLWSLPFTGEKQQKYIGRLLVKDYLTINIDVFDVGEN